MTERTYVVGVGMTKFDKPGVKDGDYPDWVREAGRAALEDAAVRYEQVEQAFAGYCYGDSTSGQRALYKLGLTGIPVVNVNNNCSTGSSAIYLARQAVRGGLAACVLAVGFERMQRGSLRLHWEDRVSPMDHLLDTMEALRHPEQAAPMPQMFGSAGREHMERYGSRPGHFAWIAWKNHQHSVGNPYAQFQKAYTLEEVEQAPVIFDPLTRLHCSPTSDGAAAVVIASERFVDEYDLWDRAIELAGQSLVTDTPATFESGSVINLVGHDLSRDAARGAMDQAQIAIDDVDVIELHDCFSTNELITYEALGLAEHGEGHLLVERQATTYGGTVVVNPSGGLISKGHPLGATGIAQCCELTWQLRGTAGPRQVPDATIGLQHNIGLGGAAVVSIYKAPAA